MSIDDPHSLPTGVTTFLFTDIVGSTELWDREPRGMARSLEQHDAIIARAVSDHGGTLVRSRGEGDSTFSVFSSPTDAAAAAVRLQDELRKAVWPDEVSLAVRAALHTGEAELRDGEYYGGVLNRTARIRGLAAGGEILCSSTTADLIGDALSPDLTLVDVGTYRLKGLRRRETVHALGSAATSTGPLGRAASGAHAKGATGLVGRGGELTALDELLLSSRLVTITGPGGIGKTRLAFEQYGRVADGFERSWAVRLAGLQSGADIAAAIETAVVPQSGGVGQHPPTESAITSTARTVDMLGPRHALLLIDNCEHVVESAVAVLQVLLAECPHLQVMCTSRERLGIQGEQVLVLRPLEVPAQIAVSDLENLCQVESMQLLLQRAQAGNPAFDLHSDNAAALIDICRTLDGLPLALELAAARLASIAPAALAQRLGQLNVLAQRSRERRHETLHATLDWSHDLLSPAARTLFRRLSVFSSGFTLDAAEVVCSVIGPKPDPGGAFYPILAELVDKSLVNFDGETERYRMLEPIRLHAAAKLSEAGEREEVRRSHARWVLAIARRSLTAQTTGGEARALSDELDNADAALTFAEEHYDDVLYAQLVGALGYTWFQTGWHRGLRWAVRATNEMVQIPKHIRAGALLTRGMLQSFEHIDSVDCLTESLDLYREVGSRPGEAWATHWLARSLRSQRLFDAAKALFEELHLPFGTCWCLIEMARDARMCGALGQSRAHLEEAGRVARENGLEVLVGVTLAELGMVAFWRGDYEKSCQLLQDAVDRHLAASVRWDLSSILVALGRSRLANREFDRAEVDLLNAISLSLEFEGTGALRAALVMLAALFLERGDIRGAQMLFSATGWDVEFSVEDRQFSFAGLAVETLSRSLRPTLDDAVAEGRRRGLFELAKALVDARLTP